MDNEDSYLMDVLYLCINGWIIMGICLSFKVDCYYYYVIVLV